MKESTDIKICIDRLDWELSAAETYARAIELFRDAAVRPILDDGCADHLKNASVLRDHLKRLGNQRCEDATLRRSVFLASVDDAATLFGERSVLVALLQGEEAGRADYDAALHGDHLTRDLRAVVDLILMPRLRRHISTLRGLKGTR